MPIRNYSVVKGKATGGKIQFNRNGNSPHYLIGLNAGGQKLQAAVNIESQDGSEVLYLIDHSFTPPDPGGLASLPAGRTALDSVAGGLALDYVRSRVNNTFMVDRRAMSLLPVSQGPQNSDLQNAVVDLLDQAVAEGDGTVYAFGSFYEDAGQSAGIHDIHMNQGNPADNHGADNGVWQDGAVFINLASKNRWMAIFIAFQSQAWHTDNHGDPA
ncbi:MAG TPA: YukJ family protein [Bryobacteraceae bacterium]|nr:YukJ family protein [Bryobacteraceae bacterium]